MMERKLEAEVHLASKSVFEGKLLRVRVDTVRLPSGRRATREVVGHRPAVVVVPIDPEGNVIMVRQYRYAVGDALLEAPAGVVEKSETPEECAHRELREETGYLSRDLRSLGQFWASPGVSTELMYAFVARELASGPTDPDPDEILFVEKVPLSGVAGMIREGEVKDAKSIAALLMATCLFEQG